MPIYQLTKPNAAPSRIYPSAAWWHPINIADLILFLVSDRAGAITGQTIAVEGGAGRGMNF